MRTQCYRIEAMMRAISLDQEGKGAELLAGLEPIRKTAGKVRDTDVLIGLAAGLANGNASESLIQLIEDIGVRHAQRLRKLKKALRRHRGEVGRTLKSCGKKIEREISATKSDLADQWRRNAVTRALDLSSELAAWPILRSDNLHPFRIKVKELRYVLQLSSGSDRQFVDALGEVKDAIGEWHDWSELNVLTTEVFGKGGEDSLRTQVSSIALSRLQHAIALAGRVRRQFFDTPQAKHKGRRERHPGIKMPVLATAAKLAA